MCPGHVAQAAGLCHSAESEFRGSVRDIDERGEEIAVALRGLLKCYWKAQTVHIVREYVFGYGAGQMNNADTTERESLCSLDGDH